MEISTSPPHFCKPVRLGLVAGPLPRRVRRGEVQAEEEGRLLRGERLDRRDGAIAEEIGHIAHLLGPRVAVPQVMSSGGIVVEIIDAAAAKPPEMIIAALQRIIFGELAEVPFADERRLIAELAKERRQRR